MNKAELINAIAEKAELTKVQAKGALDATLEAIAEALAKDDKVALIGINGSVLRSATTAEGTTTLSDIAAGTYIVTVGGKAFKIAVAQ